MDRSSKQNINKDIVALNNVLDQMDSTDMYGIFHPKEAKYTFFSNAYGTFSKVDHMINTKQISINARNWTHNSAELMGPSEGSPEREVHSNTGLPKNDRNISNKQLNPMPTRTWGTKTDSPEQVEWKK